MIPEQRRARILELLEEKESIISREIAEELNTSATTVWRDISALALKGKVLKTHGGAMLRKRTDDFEFLFSTRLRKNMEVKKRIAWKAASFVETDDIIALDTGTTATLLASFLKSKERITVITASLGVAQELIGARGVYTVLLGGDLKEESMSTAGDITLQNIKGFRVNKYFIGAAAIDPLRGTQDAYLFERDIKRALVSISEKRIVLADSSKFGMTSLAVVVSLDEIDTVITDKKLGRVQLRVLRSSGIDVITI